MPPRMLRNFSFGAIALVSASTLAVAPALAQETRPLTENPTLIRGCRQLNQAVEVFDNSTLGPTANRVGTLAAGTRVTLTGVVSTGRAQVFLGGSTLSPVQPVGWLNASNLGPCGGTPPPTGACFRADTALVVRSGPSTGAAIVAGYNQNDLIRASTNPPTQQTAADGRRWMQVSILNGSTGWLARTGSGGVGSNITPTNCP
jgi:hypothetical protein